MLLFLFHVLDDVFSTRINAIVVIVKKKRKKKKNSIALLSTATQTAGWPLQAELSQPQPFPSPVGHALPPAEPSLCSVPAHSSWSPCKSRPHSNHHRVFPCLHLSLIVTSVQDPYIFPSVCLAYFSLCPLICPFVAVTWERGSDREEIASPLLPSSPANTGRRFQRADAPELLARRPT